MTLLVQSRNKVEIIVHTIINDLRALIAKWGKKKTCLLFYFSWKDKQVGQDP